MTLEDLAIGDVVDGRFEIEGVAGRGGMGVVYRARDRRDGATVALKTLDPSTSRSAPERLTAEVEALGRVSHPGIVRLRAHGVADDGRRYLAMEWLEGETLRDRLADGPLDVAETVELGRAVAAALGTAHAESLVHRDVKPANVFLLDGRVGHVKLLDFGIAAGPGARLASVPDEVVGTPGYMAPEQARGDVAVDARADVFALGCVLFECLAGQPAFVAPHAIAVLAKIAFDDVPRVDEIRPDVPRRVASLIARMMAKEPSERPVDGGAVERLLDDEALDEVRTTAPGPPRLTARERRVIGVVLARPGPRADSRAIVLQLRRELGERALHVEALAAGAVAVVLAGGSVATDLAAEGARCAIRVSSLLPGAPVALTLGLAEVGRQLPVGEVIDRAAALLRVAGPSEIVLDEVCAGLVDARHEVTLRQGVHRLSASLRDGGRRLLGRPTPLVGRRRELAILEGLFEECADEELPVCALVLGDPGVGKSRLRRELCARIRDREPRVQIWTARGDAVGAGSPLALAADALRAALDIAEGAAAADAWRSVQEAAEGLEEGPRRALFLGELLGLGDLPADDALLAARRDPVLMQDQLQAAFRELVTGRAARSPVVIVLDDLHWGDAASLRLLAGLLEQERSIFLLGFGRPDAGQALPPRFWRHGMTELRLMSLSERASRELARAVLGEGIDDAVLTRIVERSGGNAFYLEELIRAVAEGRGDRLPQTVLASSQARLSGLPARPRFLLRVASIFGRIFPRDGLAALLAADPRFDDAAIDGHLRELSDAELVAPVGADGRHWSFRHDLLRDAAYALSTDEDRRRGHELAGRFLAALPGTAPIAVARHLELGGQPGEAADAYARAAVQALAVTDFDDAFERARRALELGASDPGRLLVLQAEVHRWRGEHDEADAAAIAALARVEPAGELFFRALAERITACGRRGEYSEVVELAGEVLGVEAAPGAQTARALCLCALGRQLFHAGRYDLGDRAIARVRALVPDPDALEPSVAAQVHGLLAAAARHRGDLLGDLHGYRAMLAACERADDARLGCNTRVSVGFAHVELGDFETAEVELRRALADAERMGLPSVATRARQNLGPVLASRGEHGEAMALVDRVIEESRQQGNARFEGWTLVYRAQIALLAGRADEAVETGRLAAERLEVSRPAQAGALAVLARALVAAGRADEARAPAREALEVLHELGGIEEFEALVRVAHAEAEVAVDPVAGAAAALDAARRLADRAAAIDDPEFRRSFLDDVPENAATLRLAAHARRQMDHTFDEAMSPERFEREGRELLAALAAHLDRSRNRRGRAHPAVTPDAMSARFGSDLSSPIELSELLADVLAGSVSHHDPRYVGYQVTCPLPRAALLDLCGSLLNNGMANFASGPANSAMERAAVRFLCDRVGWPDGDGVLTSGGSIGNLTALLAARQARAGFDAWADGLAGGPPLSLLASEDAHYCVERAGPILGLGRAGVIGIALDAGRRCTVRGLEAALAAARDAGRRPFAVVANAGSTPVGAIDPLHDIADVCEREGLWLHVDAAHGGSLLLSERLRGRLAGIERADSLVWDAHKLMLVPALATAVLFRDAEHGWLAFEQRAPYLWNETRSAYDLGRRTLECTKRGIGLTLYGTLRTHGPALFGRYVERVVDVAADLADAVRRAPDFELAVEPSCNIVAFRFLAPGLAGDELDAWQSRARERLASEGGFFVAETRFDGRTWLRATITHPETGPADVGALLDALRRA